MSDPLTHPYSFGLPTGRLLDVDSGGYPEGAVGNICPLPRAISQRVEMMRKRLPEVSDENLDRSVHPWVDTETGETYELIRGHLDVIAPESSGAVAFVVSDGWIVGLREAGTEQKVESVFIGNLGGGRAS